MPHSTPMAEFAHARVEALAPPVAARTPKPAAAPQPLLQLQRLAGNAAVDSVIVQRLEENLPTQSGGGGGGGGGGGMLTLVALGKSGFINVKLQNGAVVDASASLG